MQRLGIVFSANAVRQAPDTVMGFQTASMGFIRAVARYANTDTLCCVTATQQDFNAFREVVSFSGREPKWIPYFSLPQSCPEHLLTMSATLSEEAWRRRIVGADRYGITSMLHTTYGPAVERITSLTMAPVGPHDALVCTSQALRQVVSRLIDGQMEYLEERFEVTPQSPNIEVVPLGIECDDFLRTDARTSRARELRRSLGIADEAVVVMSYGRISSVDKASPLPLFHAMDMVRRRLGPRVQVHLLMAGFFKSPHEGQKIQAAAQRWYPELKVTWADGTNAVVRECAWHAANIFVSLADNIQETFGLTPIEAMAAGLPVVASEWNGYKESARHGVDGLLIPTSLPSESRYPLQKELALGVMSPMPTCFASRQ